MAEAIKPENKTPRGIKVKCGPRRIVIDDKNTKMSPGETKVLPAEIAKHFLAAKSVEKA